MTVVVLAICNGRMDISQSLLDHAGTVNTVQSFEDSATCTIIYDYVELQALDDLVREFKAESLAGVTSVETCKHNNEPRCPAYWRGSDRRWG